MANLLKKIKARLLRLPVFVFNNKRKHKSYIFKGNKENFYSLIITHSEYSGKRENETWFWNKHRWFNGVFKCLTLDILISLKQIISKH